MAGEFPRPRRLGSFLLVIAVALGLAACGSPEAGRTRGGGDGADVGNREGDVQLQGDEDQDQRIYYETPARSPLTAS